MPSITSSDFGENATVEVLKPCAFSDALRFRIALLAGERGFELVIATYTIYELGNDLIFKDVTLKPALSQEHLAHVNMRSFAHVSC